MQKKTILICLLSIVSMLVSCSQQQDWEETLKDDSNSLFGIPSKETIISTHTSIYTEALYRAMQSVDCSYISDETDSIAYEVVNGYLHTLSNNAKDIAVQQWRLCLQSTRTEATGTSLDRFPLNFKEKINNSIIDEDFYSLSHTVEEILSSEWYNDLTIPEQEEVYIDLHLLISIREIIFENAIMQKSSTRMSPGDRMIWSDSMSRLTPEQRKKVIAACLSGIGAVTSSALSLGLSIIGLLF